MPSNVVFVVNPAGFKSAFKSWAGSPVGRYMKLKNEQVRAHAVAGAPGPGKPPKNTTGISYGKGELSSRITITHHHSPGGDLEGHVVAHAKHALWVHEGTRGPYPITPRKPGGSLHFFWAKVGHSVTLPRVSHPGIRVAQPFLRDALDKSF